jgi:HEPN domain-containing protein
MKAYLVHREQTFRKTHNLTELGGAVARLEPAWTDLMKHASLLTEFAWRFRYPGEPATVSRQDAEQAIALAGKVLDEVMHRLPTSCRPA